MDKEEVKSKWANIIKKHKVAAHSKSSAMEKLGSEEPEKQASAPPDEGGVFLILLFYYFQDASLVKFQPVYQDPEPTWEKTLRQILGGIFKFRLDVLHLAKSICVFPGTLPFDKVLVKLLFSPFVLIIIVAIYNIAGHLERTRVSKKWAKIKNNAALAIMLAMLFSYQKLASSMFSLVHCVPVFEDMVLKIDGNVKCFTLSQIVIFVYLFLCIIPFSFYICFAPNYLKKKSVSLPEFYLGCMFPFPVSLFWLVRAVCTKRKQPTVDASRDESTAVVYNLLQGPYREFTLPHVSLSLCWSGVMLLR